MKFLNKHKNINNVNGLEIGCNKGHTTIWLLENILTHSSCKITCIDTFDSTFEYNK